MNKTFSLSAQGKGYESITVGAAAVGLTAATYAGKQGCFITLETTNVRFRYDGTNPTAAEGHLFYIGQSLHFLNSAVLSKIKFISTGANATIRVTYY